MNSEDKFLSEILTELRREMTSNQCSGGGWRGLTLEDALNILALL